MAAVVSNNKFEAALQQYEPYLDFLDALKRPPYATLKPKQTIARAKDVHQNRKSRDFVFKDMAGRHVEKVSSGVLEASALRADIVEMRLPYVMALAALSDYTALMTDALRVDLRVALARDFSTETDKSAALRKAVAPAKTLCATYKATLDILDAIVSDLDQTYWSMKTVEDAFARGARVEGYR